MVADGTIAAGDQINVTVPTGNFGNILAAYYAKQMGLPIDRLICASNENKVLYDFFGSGTYDRNREFHLTSSPSMDILISSNLERLIYRIAGEDSDKNAAFMKSLSETGKYEITDEMRAGLSDFYGNFAGEDVTAAEIARVYNECGYVLDPHTAVASAVYQKYLSDTHDEKPAVIASTASPYKFTRSVMKALGKDRPEVADIDLTDDLANISGVAIPEAIREIKEAPVCHNTVCDIPAMPDEVLKFLGV